MSILAYNNTVACTPFQRKSVETRVSSGFGTVAQKLALTKLEVVFGNGTITPGSSVYVRGDTMKHTWANEEFEVDGQTVILVPVVQILLVHPALPA